MPAQKSTSRSKIASLILNHFSKGDGKRTPLETLPHVHVDSLLISWGLLSSPFGSETIIGNSFWGSLHQWFVIILEWLMVFKWSICILTKEQSAIQIILGDFTGFLPGDQLFYQLPYFIWTLTAALSLTIFYKFKGTDKFQWLKPHEVCKGSLSPDDAKMDDYQAAYFWQRTLLTVWVAKFLIRNCLLGSIFLFPVVYGKFWPQEYLNPLGYIWAFITILWAYYTAAIQFGIMAVFHQVCHYLIVRYEKINELANELQQSESLNVKPKYDKLTYFMNEHNDITFHLHQFNKFWCYNMAINFVTFVPCICYILGLTVFAKMLLWLRIALLFTCAFFFGCFCIPAFSASTVSEVAHESYAVLNTISQMKMPLLIKTQLQIYIQRLGGPTIGFMCLDLFAVTFDNFCHVLLMVGTMFLLLMDLTQTFRILQKNPKVNPIVAAATTTIAPNT